MPAPFELSPDKLFYLNRQLLLDALAGAAQAMHGLVLDVGCNDKPYQRYLGSRATRWIGLDRPLYAGKRTAADIGGVIACLPIRSGAVDTVLCTEMLHLVAQPADAMAELARVLAPGGALILSTVQYALENNEQPDYFRYTRIGLSHLARQAGLRVEGLYPVGGAIALVGQALVMHARPLRAHNPFARLALRWSQHLAVWADRRWRQARDPIGWVLVARKPA